MPGSYYLVKGERIPVVQIDDLTIGQTRQLQQMTGLPLGEIGTAAERGDISVMAGLLTFAILHHQPELSVEQVQRRVDDLRWDEVEFPDDEDEPVEEEDPPTLMPVDSGRRGSESASA